MKKNSVICVLFVLIATCLIFVSFAINNQDRSDSDKYSALENDSEPVSDQAADLSAEQDAGPAKTEQTVTPFTEPVQVVRDTFIASLESIYRDETVSKTMPSPLGGETLSYLESEKCDDGTRTDVYMDNSGDRYYFQSGEFLSYLSFGGGVTPKYLTKDWDGKAIGKEEMIFLASEYAKTFFDIEFSDVAYYSHPASGTCQIVLARMCGKDHDIVGLHCSVSLYPDGTPECVSLPNRKALSAFDDSRVAGLDKAQVAEFLQQVLEEGETMTADDVKRVWVKPLQEGYCLDITAGVHKTLTDESGSRNVKLAEGFSIVLE